MLLFALFTLGYFAGVITCLIVFSPRTSELEEQEKDALEPILKLQEDSSYEGEEIAAGAEMTSRVAVQV